MNKNLKQNFLTFFLIFTLFFSYLVVNTDISYAKPKFSSSKSFSSSSFSSKPSSSIKSGSGGIKSGSFSNINKTDTYNSTTNNTGKSINSGMKTGSFSNSKKTDDMNNIDRTYESDSKKQISKNKTIKINTPYVNVNYNNGYYHKPKIDFFDVLIYGFTAIIIVVFIFIVIKHYRK